MAAAELQRREVMMAESEGLIHELRAQVAQQASQPQQWTPSRRSATSTASPGWPGTAADSAALDVREAALAGRETAVRQREAACDRLPDASQRAELDGPWAVLEERKRQLREQEAEAALVSRQAQLDAEEAAGRLAAADEREAAAAARDVASAQAEADLASKFREVTERTDRLRDGERMLARAQVEMDSLRVQHGGEAATLQGLVGAAAEAEAMVHQKQRELDQRERDVVAREQHAQEQHARLSSAEEVAEQHLAERTASQTMLAQKDERLTDYSRRAAEKLEGLSRREEELEVPRPLKNTAGSQAQLP